MVVPHIFFLVLKHHTALFWFVYGLLRVSVPVSEIICLFDFTKYNEVFSHHWALLFWLGDIQNSALWCAQKKFKGPQHRVVVVVVSRSSRNSRSDILFFEALFSAHTFSRLVVVVVDDHAVVVGVVVVQAGTVSLAPPLSSLCK